MGHIIFYHSQRKVVFFNHFQCFSMLTVELVKDLLYGRISWLEQEIFHIFLIYEIFGYKLFMTLSY